MKTEDVVKVLKSLHKWMRGKGKKYVNGQIDIPTNCEALSYAITHLARRVGKDDFIMLVNMAEEDAGFRKQTKAEITTQHKSAIKSGRKVVRFLLKNNG